MEGREGIGEALTKTVIVFFIAAGILVLWVGLVLIALDGTGLRDLGGFLAFTGTLFAFIVALAGGLGSTRTTDYQNLGLLILSAALILATAQLIP